MKEESSLHLEFDPALNEIKGKKKRLQDGLSAVVQVGDTLWVANDESTTLECFSCPLVSPHGKYLYKKHDQFTLEKYIELPMSCLSDVEKIEMAEELGEISEEVDIEGLDYRDGYLWLVGSHSWGRNKIKKGDGIEELAQEIKFGNRFLLARIPLSQAGLEKNSLQDGQELCAAQLLGDHTGSELTTELKKDNHFGKFVEIPGKDNGFNIEGLAVVRERIFVGLRGPVLRGWAAILELGLEENGSSTLRLKKIGERERPYRKHFLQLGDLGIRELCVQGDDLLILAGPSMGLDGPVSIFRWPEGAKPREEDAVFDDSLEKLVEIPYGQGADHAEGMTLFAPDGGDAEHILVVYDDASDDRKKGNILKADIFRLSK